jgi:hypothetical protein
VAFFKATGSLFDPPFISESEKARKETITAKMHYELLLLLGNVLTPLAGNNTHEFREHAVAVQLFQAQFKTKI